MPVPSLEEVDAQARKLTREEQLELARRLLNRSVSPEGGAQYSVLDWIGAGKGTWKTAREVERYFQEERGAWDR